VETDLLYYHGSIFRNKFNTVLFCQVIQAISQGYAWSSTRVRVLSILISNTAAHTA